MLRNKTSAAIVAVSDLDRARGFYEGTLGLELDGDGSDGVLSFRTGDTWLVVYPSENLRPGTGNAVAWSGDSDVEAIAEDLRGKGVALEKYPQLGMRIEGGVHVADDYAVIWSKELDRNILHVNSM